MYQSPKLLMLLLNIYLNFTLIQPAVESLNLYRAKRATLVTLPIQTSQNKAIHQLLLAYIHTLEKVGAIDDDQHAIREMYEARRLFIEQADAILVEYKVKTQLPSPGEASLRKENLLLNPLFKQVNDAQWKYMHTGQLEANLQLKEAFLAMDDFMEVLYK